jgi:hypothetical protein
MKEVDFKIQGIGLREMTRRESKKTGETVSVIHERLRNFPEYDNWVTVDEVAAAFHEMAEELGKSRPNLMPKPGAFENVHLLGVQLALTPDKKIKVFFDQTTPADKAKEAVKMIKINRCEIVFTFQLAEIFHLQIPNYCPTCPAYVSDWNRMYNRRLHMEWCTWAALFEGKSKSPIRLDRHDAEYPAFKRYQNKKLVPCPMIAQAE